jgi:hypothetical protein
MLVRNQLQSSVGNCMELCHSRKLNRRRWCHAGAATFTDKRNFRAESPIFFELEVFEVGGVDSPNWPGI